MEGLLVSRSKAIALRVVGTAALLLAAFGVFYTLSFLVGRLIGPPVEEAEHFREAYFTMLSICIAFYGLLAFFGVQFWQLKTSLRYWFLAMLIGEIVYFVSIGLLWRLEDEEIATSIASATGIANGGLMAQGITLFPIWATIIVFWAHSNGRQSEA